MDAADAQPPASETINTVLSSWSPPTRAPYFGSASGTFTASGTFSDSGTLSAQTLNLAYPAPATGGLKTVRMLTSSDGTLELSCTEIARVFTNLSAIPDTGSCAVLSGTGEYAAQVGSGTLTGVYNAFAGTLSDTIVFGRG